MSPRTFNIICIATLIAVVALAMALVAMSPQSVVAAPQTVSPPAAEGSGIGELGLMPLGLGLSLTIVADMGLMTLGLVILFKEEAPSRYRVR